MPKTKRPGGRSSSSRPRKDPARAADDPSAQRHSRSASDDQPALSQPPGEAPLRQSPGPVRIVAVGASAGGLEALERMFRAMPVDSGLAFAVVQHLSPDFRSMMDELLARQSRMKIRHAVDGTEVEPNTVYLNPPRQNLVIIDGKLFLRAPDPSEMPNHPIDAFFTSLAKDRGAQAIGVILSGTGTDGTKGALAILQAGGTVLVQEPGSAKFENMPRSAIEKGAASATALPDEIPTLLARLITGEPLDDPALDPSGPIDPEAEIIRLLEKRFGANFGYYKKSTVGRRVSRRAALNGLQDLANYAAMLRRDPAELEHLYADLLIGVTAFFRDRAAFDALLTKAIPSLAEQMSPDRPLRIWVPGCASGEEAYSIAILLSEHARENDLHLNVKIFATDLHYGSLETAGLGIYSAQNLQELGEEVRDRYFDDIGGRFQAKSSLRRLVVFSPHNLIKDPPFTRLDLISCRNLLIYLDEVAQTKVLSLFHFALLQNGFLYLGPSETIGELQDEFVTVESRWKIFRKLRNIQLPGSTRLLPAVPVMDDSSLQAGGRPQPRSFNGPQRPARTDRRYLLQAYDAILARHAPPSLLVTRTGELVHVFGDASRYLRLKAGLFSSRLVDVVVEPLKLAVSACIDGVRMTSALPIAREVTMRNAEGAEVAVEVRAELMASGGSDADHVLISLSERRPERPATDRDDAQRIEKFGERAALQGRVEELERNLHFTEESLQTTIEELETSNEELQSTNEELMSANEELQSTNEELHAVNEELYSVSAEHQRKIDELVALTNDMDHLLRCTDVGTIFLDHQMRVRRYTPAVAKAFNLLDRDIGRPIDHITSRFAYPELTEDVAKVAATGNVIERTVTVDESSLLLRVFPFHVGDATRGIVITLIDVSRLKQAERTLEARNQELARVNQSLEQFTYIVSHDLRAPLRTILNSAKWIEEDLGAAATEEIRGHCQRLMTYSKRLTDMLDDLMEYARLEQGDKAVETVDVRQLLLTIAETIDGEARLSLEIEGNLAPFACYRAPLQQVFQNLIDNALKYAGKQKVAVTITVEDLGTEYRFSVADDGPGIAVRHHEKIFLPFRKLEHKDDKPGTGMGLALVRKAVSDAGGRIEVISDPERQPGTTFRFTWGKL